MVTGDYGLTAKSIATRIGLVRSEKARIVTGAELDRRAIGRQVKDLGFPQDASCVAVLRVWQCCGKAGSCSPQADLVLQAEDRVIVLTTIEQEQEVAQALA